MGRPKNTPIRKALRKSKRTLEAIEKLDPRIAPKWHEKMVAHWRREVERLTELDRSERSAH